MSDISENEANEETLEVPLTKQKKPRSQAQMEAFEKVKEKRRQNLEAKKQEKILNSAKLLIEEETKKASVKPAPKKKLKPVEPLPESESESESEEEVIVVKKSKPKPKKKVRKIIIEESSSEEEEEDYYQEPRQKVRHCQIVRPNLDDIFC